MPASRRRLRCTTALAFAMMSAGCVLPQAHTALAPTATYVTTAPTAWSAGAPDMRELPAMPAAPPLLLPPPSPPAPERVSIAEPSYPLGAHAKFMRTHLDSDFSPAQRSEIIRAFEAWNYVMNGVVVLDTSPRTVRNREGPTLQALMETRGELLVLFYVPPIGSKAYRTSYAVAEVGDRTIHFIGPNIDSVDIVFGVTLHELAHVFGARHDRKSTLMHPSYARGRYEVIDPATMRQIADHLGVPADRLRCTERPCQL